MIKSEIKKDRKKLFKIISIIVLILIILGFIAVLVLSSLKSSYRKLYKTGEELMYEQILYNNYEEIDIKTKMTDIYIKSSQDGTVKLLAYGEKDYIAFKERGNKLFVNNNPKDLIGLNLYKYISKIELYIPSGYKKVIRIESEFGNIEIDEFIDSTIYLKEKYGDVLSKGSNYIKIFNDTGDITIDKTTMGRIYSNNSNIKIGTIDDLVIENENGKIDIDSVNKYLKIDNESGDINIGNLILEKDSEINNHYGIINIGKTNEIYIKAKTDRGIKTINNNYKNSEVLLNIYNKSGSIKVDN